jgi:hypothetical protein
MPPQKYNKHGQNAGTRLRFKRRRGSEDVFGDSLGSFSGYIETALLDALSGFDGVDAGSRSLAVELDLIE